MSSTSFLNFYFCGPSQSLSYSPSLNDMEPLDMLQYCANPTTIQSLKEKKEISIQNLDNYIRVNNKLKKVLFLSPIILGLASLPLFFFPPLIPIAVTIASLALIAFGAYLLAKKREIQIFEQDVKIRGFAHAFEVTTSINVKQHLQKLFIEKLQKLTNEEFFSSDEWQFINNEIAIDKLEDSEFKKLMQALNKVAQLKDKEVEKRQKYEKELDSQKSIIWKQIREKEKQWSYFVSKTFLYNENFISTLSTAWSNNRFKQLNTAYTKLLNEATSLVNAKTLECIKKIFQDPHQQMDSLNCSFPRIDFSQVDLKFRFIAPPKQEGYDKDEWASLMQICKNKAASL